MKLKSCYDVIVIGAGPAGKIAAEAVQKQNFSAPFLFQYASQYENRMLAKQRLLYTLKNEILNWGDRDFEKAIELCKKIPKETFSAYTFLKITARNNLKLLLQLAKVFIKSKLPR